MFKHFNSKVLTKGHVVEAARAESGGGGIDKGLAIPVWVY